MIICFYKKKFNRFFSTFDYLHIDKLSEILPLGVEIVFTDKIDSLENADVVIFDIPFLNKIIKPDDNITKRQGQIWVAWCLESEENYPWIRSPQIEKLFDIRMSYHMDADIILPYYNYSFLEKLLIPVSKKSKDVCLFISSPVNKSKRIEYLTELMKYLEIDSYGCWRKNCSLKEDKGYLTKQDIIKEYKFTIAFENAISMDYVTEKFFDPLLVGSVPIYFGAPNIEMFSPGNKSFIDVRNYSTPKDLATDIKRYCQDEESYNTLLSWKKYSLNSQLKELLEEQKTHPFERLYNLICTLKKK